ncbi:MAG: hypothetical protein ACFFBD_29375, partial [Candidatus Hodarchaeota archaeon]
NTVQWFDVFHGPQLFHRIRQPVAPDNNILRNERESRAGFRREFNEYWEALQAVKKLRIVCIGDTTVV